MISASLVALALPLVASSANATQARVRIAGLAPVATKDVVVNTAITTSFDLALTQRHEAALTTYIANLSNTGSPEYHRYLTPASYAATYGATSGGSLRCARTSRATDEPHHPQCGTRHSARARYHERHCARLRRAGGDGAPEHGYARARTSRVTGRCPPRSPRTSRPSRDSTQSRRCPRSQPRPRSTVGHYAGHVPVGGLVDRHPAQQPGRLYRATAGRTLRTEHGVGQG